MKHSLLIFAIFATIILYSCKKIACENCDNNPIAAFNKSPIAVAGADKVITLPTDSILLDGNSSHDPDGNIVAWLWSPLGESGT